MLDQTARPNFIFMLTRNDRTVADAAAHLEIALAAGVRHIGFKDIGLDGDGLAYLTARIRAAGATSYLEVVSLGLKDEIRSIEAGVGLGVDTILGGVNVAHALPILAGRNIGYFPFAGRVNGHPSVLEGRAEEIAASAVNLAQHPGVSGVDLLAYRNSGNVPALMAAVCKATPKPVIIAGSIDRPGQIAAIRRAGAVGFTVGTSALDGRFPANSPSLRDQLSAILRAQRRGDTETPPRVT